ncbi:uncharacterized protein [Spinacia oleracea]|uniref:RNA-directed DNA polymerase n=1 Tax=Spinacia oleracea TaxID=3562 RepID=A0ABM3QYU1_SPIOL|nr:uncharacterized protein LOC130463422 [Spinacia oleracea]
MDRNPLQKRRKMFDNNKKKVYDSMRLNYLVWVLVLEPNTCLRGQVRCIVQMLRHNKSTEEMLTRMPARATIDIKQSLMIFRIPGNQFWKTAASSDGGSLEALEEILHEQSVRVETQSAKILDQSRKINDMLVVMMEMKNQWKDSTATGSKSGGNHEINSSQKSLGYNPKLSFPKFDGTNCRIWIRKCSKYFSLCKIADDQKVYLASLNMVDKAESWVSSYLSARGNVEWHEFCLDLAARFKDTRGTNSVEKFNKMTQTDSIETYLDEFEDLKSGVLKTHHNLPEEFILDNFIGGLDPVVKPFVKAFKPNTIAEAVEFARLQEEQNLATTCKPTKTHSYSQNFKAIQAVPLNTSKPALFPTPSTKPMPLPVTKFHNKPNRNFRHVPADVRAEKIAKGLCYYCDQHYDRNHKCRFKEPQLFTVEIAGSNEDKTDSTSDLEANTDEDDEVNEPVLSLNALSGNQNFQTMRVKGLKGSKVFHILVDSRSTHNFLDLDLGRKMGCSIESIPAQYVTVADGNHLKCQHVCKGVKWEMQGKMLMEDVMLICLGDCDMVLGVQWLATLGPICWDFKELKMVFTQGGDQFVLKGVHPQKVKLLEGPPTVKLIENAVQLCLLQVSWDVSFQEIRVNNALAAPVGVFDHTIPLEPNARPVNIRPYRYPLKQRDIIEQLVQEMLDRGIIHNSSSPFASPVVLLIDELAGATVFSKLDLRASYHQLRVHDDDVHKTAFKPILAILNSFKTMEDHWQHLTQVFELMRQNMMFAKGSKCSFAMERVEYLGHYILAKGVGTDPHKISAVDSWPIPSSVKELRSFLGLAGYYRNPNLSKVFVVETDASCKGIGAVLMQDNHPLAYISRTLGPKWQKLSVYEKELLAIVFAVQKWEQYLMSTHFVIKTDQKSLKWLLQQKYKSGKENVAADALSRVQGSSILCMAISVVNSDLNELIKAIYSLDDSLIATLASLQQPHTLTVDNFTLVDGLLRRKHKLVVGPDINLRTKINTWLHSEPESGHSGRDLTLRRVKNLFYWKGLTKDVRQFVKSCKVCQTAKYDTSAYPGLLQPLPIPEAVWVDISMDFITGLPKSGGKEVIFVVVDILSKYSHFMSLSPFHCSPSGSILLRSCVQVAWLA